VLRRQGPDPLPRIENPKTTPEKNPKTQPLLRIYLLDL
jgi:hypothetical protein